MPENKSSVASEPAQQREGLPGDLPEIANAVHTAVGDGRLSPRDRSVITLLLVSAFVVILNETIMGVALPRLMEDLDITASAAQWLTTAFMLTMAVVIPVTGFLLQRFNTRPVFAAAMSLFSLGTLVSALAPGFEVLLVGRVIQATGTAIMMPLLMTTVMTLVPPSSRGKVMGNISIVISVAPAIGPTISGFILSILDWRWMFWLVLPIAAAALSIGVLRIKNVTEPKHSPIDLLSVVLSAFAFGGLIYGLSQLGEAAHGGGTVPAWLPIAVGGIALLVFVLRQRRLERSDRALLDLRTFASRSFTVSILTVAVLMMTLFGMIIVLPIYMQSVLGLDPLATGALLLPGGLVMGLLGPVVGRIYDARGARILILPGTMLVSAVFWGLAMMDETTPVFLVLAAHVFLSVGLGLTFTPLLTSALAALRPELYSHGSAVVGTVQQLAGAAGTALFISVMTLQSAGLASAGVGEQQALAGGMQAAFLCGAVISVLAVVAGFFIKAPTPQAAGEELAPVHS